MVHAPSVRKPLQLPWQRCTCHVRRTKRAKAEFLVRSHELDEILRVLCVSDVATAWGLWGV